MGKSFIKGESNQWNNIPVQTKCAEINCDRDLTDFEAKKLEKSRQYKAYRFCKYCRTHLTRPKEWRCIGCGAIIRETQTNSKSVGQYYCDPQNCKSRIARRRKTQSLRSRKVRAAEIVIKKKIVLH